MPMGIQWSHDSYHLFLILSSPAALTGGPDEAA